MTTYFIKFVNKYNCTILGNPVLHNFKLKYISQYWFKTFLNFSFVLSYNYNKKYKKIKNILFLVVQLGCRTYCSSLKIKEHEKYIVNS